MIDKQSESLLGGPVARKGDAVNRTRLSQLQKKHRRS